MAGAQGGIAGCRLRFLQGSRPGVGDGVGHAGGHVEAAHGGPLQVNALLAGRGQSGQGAGQPRGGQHRQDAHRQAFCSGPGGLGRVAGEDVDVAAAQRLERFATALKRHKAHALVVLPRCAHQQRGLHPVLAAQRAAGAKHHAARIFLQCGDHVLQALVGGVAVHRHHAVVVAQRCNPAHGAHRVRAEAALRQVEQRAAGERHQRAGPSQAARGHLVKRHRTNAAGQVAGAQRRAAGAHGLQRLRCQATGQVESAAGA